MVELAHHAASVRFVAFQQFGSEGVRRLEPAHPQCHARVLHRPAQDANRATVVDCVRNDLHQPLPRSRLATVTRDELLPRLRLRLLDEGNDLIREEPQIPVICRRRHRPPLVLGEVGFDVALEGRFGLVAHCFTPGWSSQ